LDGAIKPQLSAGPGRVCTIPIKKIWDNQWQMDELHYAVQTIYTVSQKTSPTFLAITRESFDGFL